MTTKIERGKREKMQFEASFRAPGSISAIELQIIPGHKLVCITTPLPYISRVHQPRIVLGVARTGDRQAKNLTVAIDEPIKDLPGIALEPRSFHAFGHRLIETDRNLALVGDLGNKARALRTGLGELNFHGISQNNFWWGWRNWQPACKDGDCD